jgi:hypothetical protein
MANGIFAAEVELTKGYLTELGTLPTCLDNACGQDLP